MGLIACHAATGVIPAWLAEDCNDQSSLIGNLNTSCDGDMMVVLSSNFCIS
jgi:hypothetical protein